MSNGTKSYFTYKFTGMAIDPIHVGSGSSRLGRVDNAIVRDPVTRIPKIPGSSLAGVHRAYAAMGYENDEPNRTIEDQSKTYYPDCAGQGGDNYKGHCGKHDCPICTVFGFAKGSSGGFAGLASFSDAHVLLFPVPTREGPFWITSPTAMRIADKENNQNFTDDVIHVQNGENNGKVGPLNLGWLMLERKPGLDLSSIDGWEYPEPVRSKIGLVSDKLFSHVVNSNLEVRTSVAIDPATGAAEDKALFTYEALPRSTVLFWEVTCKNPAHFKIGDKQLSLDGNKRPSFSEVVNVTKKSHAYLEYFGIGGMTTRGMGRLKVYEKNVESANNGDCGSEGCKNG